MCRYRFCSVCKNVKNIIIASTPAPFRQSVWGLLLLLKPLKQSCTFSATAFSFCRFIGFSNLNIAVAGTVHKFSTAGCKCQEVCKLFSWLFYALIYGGECETQKNILVRRFYFDCNLLLKGREENSTRLREKFTMRFGLLMGFTAI